MPIWGATHGPPPGLVLGPSDGAEGLGRRVEFGMDVTGPTIRRVDQDEPEVGVVCVQPHSARDAVGVVVGMGEHARERDHGPIVAPSAP